MNARDGQAANDASIGLLDHSLTMLRRVEGPISAGTAAAALTAVTAVVRSRQRPPTPKIIDAIIALIEAVREDIGAMREEANGNG
jgi:hypothetical protein